VLVGACWVAFSCFTSQGWPGVPAEGDRLDRLETDRGQLERRREVIRYLAGELAEGRLDLRKAAAALRNEDLSSPPRLSMHIENLPGATQEERYCRALVGHVRVLLERDARLPAVVARLEAEVEALPPPPGPPLGTLAGRRLPAPAPDLTTGAAPEEIR
jgi:hypothetical protein